MLKKDEIFDGLARLYKDEAHNIELRNAIKAKIDARLADIHAASASATATRKVLADSTDAVDLAQGQLQHLSQQLNGDEIYSQILQKFIPNWVEISLNVAAVNFLRVRDHQALVHSLAVLGVPELWLINVQLRRHGFHNSS